MDTSFKYILCRLCLCTSDRLIDIYDENSEQGFVISEVIEDLLHFKVNNLRGLPWLVCVRCLEKLKEFRLFKLQCIDSKVAFESRLQEEPAPTKVQDEEISVDYLRRIKTEDVDVTDDIERVIYPRVGRLKQEKAETEIDQGFYPQVILETLEEGDDAVEGNSVLGQSHPKDCESNPDQTLQLQSQYRKSTTNQSGISLRRIPQSTVHHERGAKVFRCGSCGKSFVKSSHLTRHIRTHTNDRPYACELCGKRYIENSDLTSHMMSHTGQKPFECPHCGKGFYRNSHLNRHINTHRTSIARAHATLMEAAGIRGGKKSVEAVEDGSTAAMCENDERYAMRSLHFMGGLLENPVSYTGEERMGQTRSRQRSPRGPGRPRLFHNGATMDLGEFSEMGNQGDRFISREGMEEDQLEASLNSQDIEGREDGKSFLCSFCGKAFGKNSQLLRHTRTHTDDRPFVCVTCGRRYIEASDLNQHIKVHSGIKPYRCTQCGKGFMKNSHLKRHRSTHTNDRPFICKVCRKGFIESSDLNRHMVVHSKEPGGDGRTGKDFECNLCSKAFSYKSNLVTHMRTHSGSKPFVCEYCGKGFAQNGNLITHRRVHTGERPHVCCFCNKGFSQKSTLNHHFKTHLGQGGQEGDKHSSEPCGDDEMAVVAAVTNPSSLTASSISMNSVLT